MYKSFRFFGKSLVFIFQKYIEMLYSKRWKKYEQYTCLQISRDNQVRLIINYSIGMGSDFIFSTKFAIPWY